MNEDKILNYFRILKKEERIGTSYLFVGDNFPLVINIIKMVICESSDYFCNCCWDCKGFDSGTHPDMHNIEPLNTVITIESIREAQRFLSLKSFHARRKVVIVKNAESLGLEAANAFLKTLEEPPRNSFIAICSTKQEGLLPTVVSRCRKIYLPFSQDLSRKISVSLVSSFLNGERINFGDRKEFDAFLWTMAMLFRDHLVSRAVGLNISLLKDSEYEILGLPKMHKSYSIQELEAILSEILRIYGRRSNINENLALNLLRLRL